MYFGPSGLLLLILPHRDHTFDWRRPVTTMEHMRKDCEAGVAESDLTHLDEVLSAPPEAWLASPGAKTAQAFRERSLNNAKFRAIHHPTYLYPETATEIVREVGFSVVRQDLKGFSTLSRWREFECGRLLPDYRRIAAYIPGSSTNR